MLAKYSQRSILEGGGIRTARHIGHIGWLIREDETQALMQKGAEYMAAA